MFSLGFGVIYPAAIPPGSAIGLAGTSSEATELSSNGGLSSTEGFLPSAATVVLSPEPPSEAAAIAFAAAEATEGVPVLPAIPTGKHDSAGASSERGSLTFFGSFYDYFNP